MSELIKFGRIAHVSGSNLVDTDDFWAEPECERDLLTHIILVQEKLDGLNIGFSYDGKKIRARDKKDYIDTNSQIYKKIPEWMSLYSEDLNFLCDGEHTVFGEWMYWKHQRAYNDLPSFFVVHDILDEFEDKFMSTKDVDDLIGATSLSYNKPFFKGRIDSVKELPELVTKSQYGEEQMEGLIVRVDSENFNQIRAKYVTPEFAKNISEHWRSKDFVPNSVSYKSIESLWTYDSPK